MARCRRRLEAYRENAFLGDADQRRRLVESGDRAFGDQHPFVEDVAQANAALLHEPGDLLRAALAAELLVLAEGEVDRLARPEARGDAHLHRFHDRHQVALVVPGAAAPDEAVLLRARERSGLPVALGAGRDRHDVLVRQQRDRRSLGVAAGPCVEQAVLADDFAAKHRVRFREARLQQRLQRQELGCVRVGVGRRRDGLQSHGGGEALAHRGGIDCGRRHRRRRDLPRRGGRRFHTRHDGEREDDAPEQREPLPHGQASRPLS